MDPITDRRCVTVQYSIHEMIPGAHALVCHAATGNKDAVHEGNYASMASG